MCMALNHFSGLYFGPGDVVVHVLSIIEIIVNKFKLLYTYTELNSQLARCFE